MGVPSPTTIRSIGAAVYRRALNGSASRTGNAGAWPTATLGGREFWVVPFVSLVEGVLNGSKGPLFYPADEIRRNPGAWNGVLITNGHPTADDGGPLDGKTPEAEDRFGLGRVYNDWADANRRGGEAWFDKELTRRKAPEVAARLQRGEMIDLSTGLGTRDYPGEGRDARNRWYWATARDYDPNHLAVLPGQRGACSLADGCGIGRNAECAVVTNAMPQEMWNGICPRCGATLDENGHCAACGWEPSLGAGPFDTAEDPNQKPVAAYNAETLLERMWDRVVNAFLPGQPRSRETGKIKRIGAGTGRGDEHRAAQAGFHAFTPSDAERELAAGITDPTLNPGWVADEGLWGKARKVASDGGHGDDWPYVVGVYQRMGGGTKTAAENKYTFDGEDCPACGASMEGDPDSGECNACGHKWGTPVENNDDGPCHCGGTCDGCKGSPGDDTQGEETMNRNQMVAFLDAQPGPWKGKAAVLNARAGDKFVLDDGQLKALVDDAKAATANAAVATAVREALGDDAPTLNEMPAFIKEKIKAKEDDEDEEEEDEEDGKKKTTNKKAGADRQDGPTVNFANLTPEQIDQISVAITGKPAAQAKAAVANSTRYEEREKEIVVNRLTAHIQDPAQKQARRAKLLKLALPELHDRLADLPTVAANLGDSDDAVRVPYYGGRLLLDAAAPSPSYNADDYETFQPTPVMNWDKKDSKTTA